MKLLAEQQLQPLQIRGLWAGYRHRDVIRELSLGPLQGGQVVTLVGPNAAGKSTLLRALAGLLPARGSVRLGELELLGLPLDEHARLVTYSPQELPQQLALTVLEAVIAALRVLPSCVLAPQEITRRAIAVLERVGIVHLALEAMARLSGGQRQLVSLAQALVREPRMLLLDEPVSALDLNYQLRVMKLLRRLASEEGVIVVMVLHDLSMAARWSDRIAVLSQGRLIAAGVPADAITPHVLAEVYHVSARVETCSQGTFTVLVDDLI